MRKYVCPKQSQKIAQYNYSNSYPHISTVAGRGAYRLPRNVTQYRRVYDNDLWLKMKLSSNNSLYFRGNGPPALLLIYFSIISNDVTYVTRMELYYFFYIILGQAQQAKKGKCISSKIQQVTPNLQGHCYISKTSSFFH